MGYREEKISENHIKRLYALPYNGFLVINPQLSTLFKSTGNFKFSEYFQFQYLLEHIQQLKTCKEEYRLLYQWPSQYRVNWLICAGMQFYFYN